MCKVETDDDTSEDHKLWQNLKLHDMTGTDGTESYEELYSA